MSDLFHLDYETRSAADLKKCGAYRYASDESAAILLCGISKNNSEPILWDCYARPVDNAPALALLNEAVESGSSIYAHNCGFEIAITKYLWEKTFNLPPPKLTQWRDTAALCRRMAIPFSLEKAAEFLKLGEQKNKEGALLIKKFCIGESPATPFTAGLTTLAGQKITYTEAWERMRLYCLQDVRTEHAIHEALGGSDLEPFALAGFTFDIVMNDRGLPVNLDALHKAKALVTEYQSQLREEFQQITGFLPSQTGATLKWLKERGYQGDNLRAATMDEELEDEEVAEDSDNSAEISSSLTPEARRALEIRSLVSFAAVKKINSMIDCAGPDARIRGSFLWSGALRTHRWSGRLIQPQNFKKPAINTTEHAYADIIAGASLSDLEMLYGNPLECIASCIRHFIQEPDCQILDADYSSIEARITPWLCGQDDMLQAFRDGRDLYREMGQFIYNIPAAQISDDQRWVAKQAVLACCFGVGPDKFHLMCKMNGKEIPEAVARKAVAAYREKNTEIAASWRRLSDLMIKAIEEPGKKFSWRHGIWIGVHGDEKFPRMIARLPSGHKLIYPLPSVRRVTKKYTNPKTGETRTWDGPEISYYGPLPGKAMWGRITTHGGKILENLVQSIAGDFMTFGALNAESQGYEITMLVHDQAIAPYHPEKGHSADGFREALTVLPEWAKEFPLAATAKTAPFYKK